MDARVSARIQNVFDEPACEHNQQKGEHEKKKGCARQLSPGAAAGGCAFDGAMIALQPIVDVAHLVHGPIPCAGHSWDNRNSASSGAKLYRTGFTTDIGELDVIYGGEKRLFRAIREIIEKYDPPAVFVYQTCVTALIGDDIEAVCERASERFAKPVIPVNVPGFVGPKNLGNKLGAEALLDYVVGREEPELTTACDINLIGDYNVCGEQWQIKPLLEALGIRVLASFSGDARYRDIAASHRARAAMLLCSKSMINVARKMEERWGIPFFEGSFYGISDTSKSLRDLARLLVARGAPADLVPRTPEDKERIREIMGEDAHLIENMKPREMYAMLSEARADIMLSGGRTQFVALKARMPWLDINQERHYAYAGYEGIVSLVREIDKTINNPVWTAVRAAAPWDDPEEMAGEGE
jgi:nitrogenase molybdenum-cofactor synthesis protein NifE